MSQRILLGASTPLREVEPYGIARMTDTLCERLRRIGDCHVVPPPKKHIDFWLNSGHYLELSLRGSPAVDDPESFGGHRDERGSLGSGDRYQVQREGTVIAVRRGGPKAPSQ